MTPFKVVSANDLLKATLFICSRLAASGCWEWVGSKDGRGYGVFCRGNKTCRAHRISYEAYKGKIPADMVICHSCDNPSCINPDHLRVGTMKENMADREARGRRDVKGEQIGTSKLTESDVREIRSSSLSLAAISEKYGIDKSNAWLVKTGRSWKHVGSAVRQ